MQAPFTPQAAIHKYEGPLEHICPPVQDTAKLDAIRAHKAARPPSPSRQAELSGVGCEWPNRMGLSSQIIAVSGTPTTWKH
jgi:hypothetical protein